MRPTDGSISPCTTTPIRAIKLDEGRLQVAQHLIAVTQILLHVLPEWYLSSLVPCCWIFRHSYDEYPFASTHGTGNGGWYSNPGATTRCVSATEWQRKLTPQTCYHLSSTILPRPRRVTKCPLSVIRSGRSDTSCSWYCGLWPSPLLYQS